MERQRALELINENVKTKNLVKHLLATEAVMRALAEHFKENPDLWGLAGGVPPGQESGDTVMVVTLSNACPSPEKA